MENTLTPYTHGARGAAVGPAGPTDSKGGGYSLRQLSNPSFRLIGLRLGASVDGHSNRRAIDAVCGVNLAL